MVFKLISHVEIIYLLIYFTYLFSGVLRICPCWILTDSPEWKETQWQANFFSTEKTWKEIVNEKGVEKKQNLQ